MKIGRRTALGASAAILACGPSRACKTQTKLPAGRIVGQVERMGHLLRSGAIPSIDTLELEAHRVIVVGAGVAGLSCARALKQAGVEDVLVLELDEQPGGTATWGSNAEGQHPWGAHYVTLPRSEQRAFGDLLVEAGACTRSDNGELVPTERTACREPEERLFVGGAWQEGLWPTSGASAADLAEFAKFREQISQLCTLQRPDGTRLFRFPLTDSALGEVGAALDQQTATAWLRSQGFASERLHWMVDYACRDDYGTRASDCSALAALAYFAGRQLAAGAEPQPVLTWPEGNGHLVQHLLRTAALRTGVLVTQVSPDGRVSGVDTSGNPFAMSASAVVMAIPSFVAARVVQQQPEELRSKRAALRYAPWWVANLRVREHPAGRGAAVAWDNVLYDSDSVGYVVATHQRGADSGPTTLTYYAPMSDGDPAARRKELLTASYEELAERCLSDLEAAHPNIRELVVDINIRKWGHAMVRPVPGVLSSGVWNALRQSFGKVHYAHTDLSGLALFDEAFAQGERAALEVLSSLARHPIT